MYYFTAQAEECVRIVERYLDSKDIMLRLSADMLYTFGNLTLGDARAAQRAREDVYQCLKRELEEKKDDGVMASSIFAFNVICILIHIPPEKEVPPLEQYIQYLPAGQRLFALSMLAHKAYLRQEYAKAQGMTKSAVLMSDRIYPIPMIYLNCVTAMCPLPCWHAGTGRIRKLRNIWGFR